MMSQDILAVVLLLTTMLFWGTTPLLEKLGLEEVDPLAGIFIRSLAVTAVLFVFYLFTGRLHELAKISGRNVILFTASGILAGFLGMWTYYYLLKMGMTTKIVPIVASYPLITALLGILILGEEVTLQRIVGIVLTIFGIVLIKQS
ncbi:MAG: EamA-like transporter family protein [Syntrophorhabdus sp. PtaU1.Bin002]|nr:MAG: EamA-like transporter family protein [Syntrophorhabdus sp. PtaB.Bin006]OPY72544.1 MAG: EamA-like transporter family protein [Syntrophorhabdus sp. PtaU1.Bin002]